MYQPTNYRPVFALAALLMIAGVGYAIWLAVKHSQTTSVPVEEVVLGPVSRVLAANGQIAAKLSVSVRSAVQGRILEVLADEGGDVAAAGLVARLDASQAQTQVVQAQAALDSGLVSLQQARLNADRAAALGLNVPRKTLEEAQLAVAGAEHEVERLKGALDLARSELAKYEIRSPMAGTLLKRNVDPGQFVDTQTVLFVIADLKTIVVQINVDELYSAQMRTGLRTLLQPAGDAAIFNGKVTFAAPVVDTDTGGRTVEIAFDDPVPLPVGLTVTANVVVEEQEAAISIPRGAVVMTDGRPTVLLARDGKAVRQPVAVVDWPSTRILVKSGLSAGDKVILEPAGLAVGQTISVKAR